MSKGLLNININIGDILAEYKLTRTQMDQMCNVVSKNITLEVYRNWVNAAKSDLNSSRNSYIRGLLMESVTNGVNTITLVGKLNNMIENGCGPFDMKEGFKNSLKVKYTASGGWYLTIPFRFGTPGAIGESEVFSDVMPPEIYKLAKSLTAQVTSEDGQVVQKGDQLEANDLPEELRASRTRPSVINNETNKVFDAYTHKSSIYAGIIKEQKTYEGATQNSYGSFRRVGSNSDPNSWIHSGIKQHNLADKALNDTDYQTITDNTIDSMLSEWGFGE